MSSNGFDKIEIPGLDGSKQRPPTLVEKQPDNVPGARLPALGKLFERRSKAPRVGLEPDMCCLIIDTKVTLGEFKCSKQTCDHRIWASGI